MNSALLVTANATLCAATDAASNGCDPAALETQLGLSAVAALDKISIIDCIVN